MILLTGASGLIGQALAKRLVAAGHELRVQVRDRAALEPLNFNGRVHTVETDFATAGERDFARLVEGCDSVIHAAALVHTQTAEFHEFELLNVRTTKQLADSALAAGVKTFAFYSTIGVYGNGPFEDITETTEMKPVTPYAVSKANSEKELRSMPFSRTVVLRPSMVFGQGDRGNLLKFIRQLKTGKFFYLGKRQVFKSLIFADDAAAATELCITKLPEGFHTLNLSNPSNVSLKDLTELICTNLGRSSNYPTLPEPLIRNAASMAEKMLGKASPIKWEQIERLNTTTTVSVQSLIEKTGFSPKWSLNDAIRQEIEWASAAGQL